MSDADTDLESMETKNHHVSLVQERNDTRRYNGVYAEQDSAGITSITEEMALNDHDRQSRGHKSSHVSS